MTEISKIWLTWLINRILGFLGPALMTYGISYSDSTAELLAGTVITGVTVWVSQRTMKKAIDSNPAVPENDKAGSIPVSLVIVPLLCLPLVGCATNQTPTDTVVAVTPYVRPAMTALCIVVLNSAVDDKDRSEKAQEIYHLSSLFESLAKGEFPSVGRFEDILNDHLPKKAHWASLSKSLANIYKGQYPKLMQGDTKAWIDFCREVVGGIADATEGYVTDI